MTKPTTEPLTAEHALLELLYGEHMRYTPIERPMDASEWLLAGSCRASAFRPGEFTVTIWHR